MGENQGCYVADTAGRFAQVQSAAESKVLHAPVVQVALQMLGVRVARYRLSDPKTPRNPIAWSAQKRCGLRLVFAVADGALLVRDHFDQSAFDVEDLDDKASALRHP